MKNLLLALTSSIGSGLALYYIARTVLVSLLWLFAYELTTDQRIFVMELGFPTFLLGVVLGGAVYWRVRLQRLRLIW